MHPDSRAPASPPPPDVFRARRERLLEAIGDGVVLLAASPELLSSRDTEVPYRPSTDLYYLTGVQEPESFALLTPHDPEHRFTLFVRPRDPERERWNGPRLGVEAAEAATGADAVYPIGELEDRLAPLVLPADRIVYAVGVDAELDATVTRLLASARRTRPRSGIGPTGVVDLDSVLGNLRLVKDADEIGRMRVAAGIAAEGHRAAMAAAGPGVGEWEIEAALESRFRELGASGPAFASIVGSGSNATYLHYTANERRTEAGDLVLVDAGAEWGMYCSDITRTFPVSGRFTEPQRTLYDLVLAAEEAAIAAVRPGATIPDVHQAAVRMLVRGLLDLGILADVGEEEAVEAGAVRPFYMHQTSHWLGLDVHDAGGYTEPGGEPLLLAAGMVLTVEPGLYLSAELEGVPEIYRGMGIRIEDTVLVTEDGHEILTRGVPVAPEEVEGLVGGRPGSNGGGAGGVGPR